MKKKFVILIIVILLIATLVFVLRKPAEINLQETGQVIQSDKSGDYEITYVDISVEEARVLIDANPDLIIVDVSPKYSEGHIPGAVNYYVGDGSLDRAIPSLDMDATYLVYCHFESASRAGAQKLIDAGFENVYRLVGDYPAWVDAGYEIQY